MATNVKMEVYYKKNNTAVPPIDKGGFTICIDAGHGSDRNVIQVQMGALEKDIDLDVALKAGSILRMPV